MLDDFSRPDESPLSQQGNWAVIDTVFTGVMSLSNRLMVGTGTGAGSDYAAMYRTDVPDVADCEVWLRWSNSASDGYLFWRLQQLGGSNAFDGYGLVFSDSAGTVYRYTDGVRSSLGSYTKASTDGDLVIVRAVATTFTVYILRPTTGALIQARSVSDSTYTTGRIGAGADAGPDFRNFGGGIIDSLVPAAHPIGGYGAT